MTSANASTADFKLMIVDDDAGTIRVLSQILKELGKIHFTTKSKDALSLAQAIMPDLILLDIEMPELCGFDVCNQITHDPNFINVPILFVTSHDDAAIEARALTSGAIDFIHKPPHPLVVKARVGNYLTLKQQTDRLTMLCKVDGLTGIANRPAFDTALELEWHRAYRIGAPLSLLMLDVDYFKQYNDTYGHLAGDNCLRAVAQKVASLVKRPGEIVARFGGEEFVVLLPNCTKEQAFNLANLICAGIAELGIEHTTSVVAQNVTVSIGVASMSSLCENNHLCKNPLDKHEESSDSFNLTMSDSLIRAADQALYKAKKSGRNRVEVDDELPKLHTEH